MESRHMEKRIKCVSTDYEDWQIFGTVWRYEDHQELLDLLLRDNQVILGGDILVYDKDRRSYAYSGSNWYYEGDSPIDSNIAAQKYLSRLINWASSEQLFISLSIKQRR